MESDNVWVQIVGDKYLKKEESFGDKKSRYSPIWRHILKHRKYSIKVYNE